MRTDVGVNPDYDCLFDPQQERPIGFCIRCGQEIYRGNPTDLCRDCLDTGEDADDESDS